MKNQVIDFYKDTKNYNGSYHNHKETCAWAGLVLYLVFCGLVLHVEITGRFIFETSIMATVFLVVAGLCVYLYITNQLSMKDIAGATAGAASLLLTEIILEDGSKFDVEHYMKVEDSADTKAQSSHVLPKILIKKRIILNTRGRGFQDRTRIMIYSLLILSSTLSLAVIWLRIYS